MKFFVDTADVSEIESSMNLASWMVSRPTRVDRQVRTPIREVLAEICDLVGGLSLGRRYPWMRRDGS